MKNLGPFQRQCFADWADDFAGAAVSASSFVNLDFPINNRQGSGYWADINTILAAFWTLNRVNDNFAFKGLAHL